MENAISGGARRSPRMPYVLNRLRLRGSDGVKAQKVRL